MVFLGTVTHERCTAPLSDGTTANSMAESESSAFGEENERQRIEHLPKERAQQAAESATDNMNAAGNLAEESQTFHQADMESPDYGDDLDAKEHQGSVCMTPTVGCISNSTTSMDVPARDLFVLVGESKGQSIQQLPEEQRVRFSDVIHVYHYQQESTSSSSIQQAATEQRSIPENNDLTDVHRQGRLRSPSTLKSTSANLSRKRPRCDDGNDDNGRVHKRQKDESPSTLKPASVSEQITSRKRPRCDNVYDDYDRANKHRKLENPFTPKQTSVAGQSAFGQRSKGSDDDNTHHYRHQKPETPAAYTPIISHTSSSLPQVASNRVAKKKSRLENSIGYKRSSGKSEKSPQTLETSHSPRPLGTRSLRRKGKSKLWELDHLGKPRLL
ncbi:hypothetical protein V8C35DRAFT_307556 [Trichoderma chlorosporum]